MSMQYLYEVPSPSFHMVPRSPFINKPSVIASSPVAIVPDVEARGNTVIDSACYIGRQRQRFTLITASPLPTGRVPSMSPRTPQNNIRQSREQQVPSQTPILGKKSDSPQAPPLQLFADDDSIFL